MRPRTWYLLVAVASASWAFFVFWLGRGVNCVIDGCGHYALLLVVGLSAILLVSTIGLARKMDRLARESLATLATSFTASGVLAMMVFQYLTDSDPIETTLGGIFLMFIGVPTVFAVCFIISVAVRKLWPGPNSPNQLSTRSTTSKESSVRYVNLDVYEPG